MALYCIFYHFYAIFCREIFYCPPPHPLFSTDYRNEKHANKPSRAVVPNNFFSKSASGWFIGPISFWYREQGGFNRAVKNYHVRTFELYRLNPDIPAHYLSRAGSLRSHRGHHFAGTQVPQIIINIIMTPIIIWCIIWAWCWAWRSFYSSFHQTLPQWSVTQEVGPGDAFVNWCDFFKIFKYYFLHLISSHPEMPSFVIL